MLDYLSFAHTGDCFGEAMAWWYALTRQKAHYFFYTLLFCSKTDFEFFFFNEIVRVLSSMKECEETE